MAHPLLTKILVVTLLALALIIPLKMIGGVVCERQARRNTVLADMERSFVSSQRLAGPILVIPYRRTYMEPVVDPKSGRTTQVERSEQSKVQFLPEQLVIESHVATDTRRRGIYEVLVYNTTNLLQGKFQVPDNFGIDDPHSHYVFGDPSLVVGISDTRGIKGPVTVQWNDASSPFLAGTATSSLKRGIQASVGVRRSGGQSYAFSIDLRLQGMQSLELIPVGRHTAVTMQSEWPHPSFMGKHLPDRREIGAKGFEAAWVLSSLATDVEQTFARCETGDCNDFLSNSLGVTFVDPVDVYLQTERSLKYGFLFVSITFLMFFLYELLKRLAIHPVQYALVGVALAIFFLLLIALSEHVPFAWAYGIATVGCVALLGFYVGHVLRSWRRGASFASLLGALYGMLFVLLRSEDHALLLGAALLFGLLAAIMIVTRRIDWYRIAAT